MTWGEDENALKTWKLPFHFQDFQYFLNITSSGRSVAVVRPHSNPPAVGNAVGGEAIFRYAITLQHIPIRPLAGRAVNIVCKGCGGNDMVLFIFLFLGKGNILLLVHVAGVHGGLPAGSY